MPIVTTRPARGAILLLFLFRDLATPAADPALAQDIAGPAVA